MNNKKILHSSLAVATVILFSGIAFIFSSVSDTHQLSHTDTYAAEPNKQAPNLVVDPLKESFTKTKEHQKLLDSLKPSSKSIGARVVNQAQSLAIVATPSADLDVIYIARTPRYYRYCVTYPNNVPQLCPGTENQKHWPDIGENLTYEAHVTAKNANISGTLAYEWTVNGTKVNEGQIPNASIQKNQDVALSTYVLPWQTQSEKVQFKAWIISPQITEQTQNNNELIIGTHDLTISYWVETGQYNAFNSRLNSVGSYSFEDWMNLHIKTLNQRLSQAVFPNVPNGVTDQVRIDKFVVADEIDGPDSLRSHDPDIDFIDGRWQSTDADSTNANGQGGFYERYADQYITTIDWGLIHELTHQLGAIDLYMMRIPEDPPNHGLQVTGVTGAVVTVARFPFNGDTFPHGDLMGGGDISPYTDHTVYSFHTAAGLQSNTGFRRGFYGEYLFDTPDTTTLQILDSNNQPIANAQVDLFQRDTFTEIFDNTPELSGITDANGFITLANRPAPSVTTVTGHTEKPNPFGQIYVWGAGGMMATRVIKDNQDGYAFLLVHDLNVAYWNGQKQNAVIPLKTTFTPSIPTSSPIPSPTPTLTPSLKPTVTLTPTRLPTVTPSQKPTITPTKKPTPTNTPKPTKTPTPTPTPDRTGPTVSITSPGNNSTVNHGSKITIKAQASDPSGVQQVSFYVNDSFKCSDSSSSYSCSWSVPDKKNITYVIKATAYDKFDNRVTASITVTSK